MTVNEWLILLGHGAMLAAPEITSLQDGFSDASVRGFDGLSV